MNRLHKKCVITSAGLHGLLALILIFCPAFFTPKVRPSDVTPVTIYPDKLVDGLVTNPGGSPGSLPPAPAVTPPAPVVTPPPPPPPTPRPEPVRVVTPPKPVVDSVEVPKEPTRQKPQVDVTHLITRPTPKPISIDTSVVDDQERQRRERQRRLLGEFDRAANNIKSGTGSATAIEEGIGSGDSGPSVATYGAWVRSVYQRAWVTPEDATTEDATVEVKVTVASDGTVTAKRIIKRSGDAAVDASVQRALDRVTTVGRPFPEGAKDKERSYIIPFNMKTKRGAA